MEALYSGNLMQAGAMVGQRILQEIGQTGIPVTNSANACATGATAFREGWTAIKAGALRPGAVRRRRAARQDGPARRRRRRQGHLEGGLARLEHDAGRVRRGGHGARAQVRHHLRAVRQGLGQESQALDEEPEVDVPDGDAARDGDERGDDRLPEHQADVLGERRRRGGGGARLGPQGARARHAPRGARRGVGADERSVVRSAIS